MGPTQPSVRGVLVVPSLGTEWHGWEADHSPLSGAEVWDQWSYTTTVFEGLEGMYSVDFTCPCLCPKKMEPIREVKQGKHEELTMADCPSLLFAKLFEDRIAYEKGFR
jgi:hypothetical protein